MLGKRLTDLLGLKYPILQGAMAWIADAELAAAVSNAGGLGIVASGTMTPDELEKEIDKVKSLTNQPWGLNVFFLSPYLDQIIDLVIEKKVPVITTGAGNPGKYISRLKENETKVIPVVSSVALAKRLEKTGVDAVIAEGMECGGHIGEITTMALLPQIVDAVDIPVIAAGGIVDGRSMLAAFVLGAEGAQIGTRFLCAEECNVHINYKNAIINAKDRGTVVTGARWGHPVRVLENKLSKQLIKAEYNQDKMEGIEDMAAGKLKLAVFDGDVDYGSVMSGQVAAMVNKIEPASSIIDDIMSGVQKAFTIVKEKI